MKNLIGINQVFTYIKNYKLVGEISHQIDAATSEQRKAALKLMLNILALSLTLIGVTAILLIWFKMK